MLGLGSYQLRLPKKRVRSLLRLFNRAQDIISKNNLTERLTDVFSANLISCHISFVRGTLELVILEVVVHSKQYVFSIMFRAFKSIWLFNLAGTLSKLWNVYRRFLALITFSIYQTLLDREDLGAKTMKRSKL